MKHEAVKAHRPLRDVPQWRCLPSLRYQMSVVALPAEPPCDRCPVAAPLAAPVRFKYRAPSPTLIPTLDTVEVQLSLGRYDIAVIGGGIIGLATAMRLTQEHPSLKVVVVEKEQRFGLHQTGHNSGVIHAGIYYSPGSQKANLSSVGGEMLRRFCDDRGIKYDMCGKLIVASDESEMPRLEELHRRGIANGARGLEMVGREKLKELEPHAAGVAAVHSPNTGIIDYGRVTEAFAAEAEAGGGVLLTGAELVRVVSRDSALYLETTRGEIQTRHVVNCAGLFADKIASQFGLDPGLRIVPFRGEFFSLRPERTSLVNGLIYPVPDPKLPFLGVHFTKRIDGSVEAGPNAVLAFAREGYKKTNFDPSEMLGVLTFPGFWRMSMVHWKSGARELYRSWVKRSFARSLRKLVPEITAYDLDRPSAGVRAQAVDRRGGLLQDFSIVEGKNSIHVLNAPSPAATCCLAISRHIVDRAQKSLGLDRASHRP